MKKQIQILVCLCVAAFMASCSSTHKMTVTGTPGTEIYDPDNSLLGTVNEQGNVKVKVPMSNYYHYLLSRTPGTDLFVPFAVDYKFVNSAKTITLLTFEAITVIGMPHVIASVSNKDNSIPFNYQAKYLKTQRTNDNFGFVPYVETSQAKTLNKPIRQTPVPGSSSETVTAAKSFTSKAAKTLKDNGKLVSGTYTGTGTLKLKGEVIETYSNMRVEVKRVSRRNVTVQVFESSGDSFFRQAVGYNVSKAARGFRLVMPNISTAVISVDNNGKMEYCHPKVNIDGDIYTLEISANKK